MKFRGHRIFKGKDLAGIANYIQGDLSSLFKDLFVGLTKLNFSDNFDSFETTVKLEVGTEVKISNTLGKATPSKFIVTRNEKTSIITQGTAWNSQSVSVINKGPVDTKATIVFMR